MSNSTAAPTTEDIVFGFLYLFISLSCLLPYIPCIIVMRDASVKHLSCYKLMFHYGLADVIQLSGHVASSFLTMFQIFLPYWPNRIFGGFTNSGWMAYMMFAVVLAFDRYVHVCKPKYNEKLFGKNSMKVWIALCWLMGLAWFAVYCTPYVGFVYFTDAYVFYYNGSEPYSELARQVGFYLNTGQMAVITLCYIFIMISIRAQVSQVAESSQAREAQKKERTLMKQAALICSFTLAMEVYWDYSPLFLPDHKYTTASMNVFWMLNGGVNPVVYLTMNRTIRRKVLLLFGVKSREKSTVMGATTRDGGSKVASSVVVQPPPVQA